MSTVQATVRPRPAGDELPRLLRGLGPDRGPIGLGGHFDTWGTLNLAAAKTTLIDAVAASGLVGHGGAWFPVATKWRAVADRRFRRPVVVANGAETEPASGKDALLLDRSPHLVLDGLSAAATALGAHRSAAYVPRHLVARVRSAVAERRRAGIDAVDVAVYPAREAFVAGQESAVVNALNGQRDAVPSFVGLRSIRERGVDNRPTVVQNVETLANVALIARFGAGWFRGLGTKRFPGTMLLTVTSPNHPPRVVEAPLGTAMGEVLGLDVSSSSQFRGALLGGYGGGWIRTEDLLHMPVTEDAARHLGASLGAGVVVLLPRTVCPLAEVARVVRYMQLQSAGQCGPCIYGLDALASMTDALAFSPRSLRGGIKSLLDVSSLVEGRGACRHPDGAARFVRTACLVFGDEVSAHLRHGPCSLVRRSEFLPVAPPPGDRSRRRR